LALDIRVSLASAACLSVLSGCAGPLVYRYDQAEERQQALDLPILILYKSLDSASGELERNLEHASVATLTSKMVRCYLTSDYDPNRRYLAQYGIEAPPALVLIHIDGTFHAQSGTMSAEQIRTFLSTSQPPGARPDLNAQIPRPVEYFWENDYEQAVQRARQRNRDLFIVYKSWSSIDSTELLNRLSRPQVAVHFVETVNCLLDDTFVANRGFVSRYGVSTVPAMIIVRRDGTHHVRVGLPTVEEIVRFAVEARGPVGAGGRGATGTPATP